MELCEKCGGRLWWIDHKLTCEYCGWVKEEGLK